MATFFTAGESLAHECLSPVFPRSKMSQRPLPPSLCFLLLFSPIVLGSSQNLQLFCYVISKGQLEKNAYWILKEKQLFSTDYGRPYQGKPSKENRKKQVEGRMGNRRCYPPVLVPQPKEVVRRTTLIINIVFI